MRLEDRVALVTGAGSGIGRAIALRFAQEGARVIVNDVKQEKAQETVDAIASGSEAARGRALAADVADSGQVKRMFAEVDREFGALDILVNNAGIVPDGGVMPEKVPHDLFEQTVRVNLLGVWYCCRAAGRTIPQHISPPRLL